ncbi:MAG TPA: hypothetical protein VIV60_26805, partial [Polyangiaceae bacterium]
FQSRRIRPLGLLALAVAALSGCLDRPVGKTQPETNNVFVKRNPAGGIDKIDILFMVDNSLSMGDKQAVLAAAVPQLLRRLTNPDCVDTEGANAQQLADPNAACPNGKQREFAPVKDIHIGIVTSSIGDFGGDTCPEDGQPQNVAMNDKAWLLGALPRTQSTLNGVPFLKWEPSDAENYGTRINDKVTEFTTFVTATTELGCGNEMILEGWYRFLVDPNPPSDILMKDSAANFRGPDDTMILDLRKQFLRPDSLLAVFMMADENDCSMRDDDYGWVPMTAAGGFRMWRGSSVCATDPNNECCYSCMLDRDASESCKAKDTSCRQTDPGAKVASAVDDVNTRCRAMKKRFGHDFLFPPSRYVNALSLTEICPDQTYGDLDCDCSEAKAKGVACVAEPPGKRKKTKNPIYMNLDPKYTPTGPERAGKDAVFLAGVVGVPWQDLAKKDIGDAEPLEYLTASQLKQENRWELFAPKPDEDYSTAALGDPLMIESFEPRSGTHPLTQQAVAGPDAARNANKINGHEWITANKDVEFACIFSLDVQLQQGKVALRTCDLKTECPQDENSDEYKVCARRFDGCSCTTYADNANNPLDPRVSHSPLCQDGQGNYGNKQYFAKAYPGLRQLQVLRGYFEGVGGRIGAGDNAIVGSICPKDLDVANRQTSGYGYNPAVKALVDRLKTKLGGTCLPRQLNADENGSVPCAIVETIPSSAKERGWCECEANQRKVVPSELGSAIRGALQREGVCGKSGLPSCDEFCLCQLNELLQGTTAGDQCLNDLNIEKTADAPGFCYVDPDRGMGNQELVAKCPAATRRLIRIVGTGKDTTRGNLTAAPAPGQVFIACSGAAYNKDQDATAGGDQ